MVLKLETAVPADALKITLLFFDAMYLEDPFTTMDYPKGPTPEALEHRFNDINAYFNDPLYTQQKIIDTEILPGPDGSELIAWARWRIWDSDGEMPDNPIPGKEFYCTDPSDHERDYFDKQFSDHYNNALSAWKAKYYRDKRHMNMHYLCTRPQHQRRGAASMLLKWGCDEADRLGLVIWAASSPMILSSGGASNLGFEPVDSFNLTPQDVGRERPEGIRWPLRKTLLKREPHSWM